ncbi:MAG: DUF4235 domain-containing protein [Actinobacteria bacterium]|nr:DUF4235 domain-containing protein [Actinomycetota bacterium]
MARLVYRPFGLIVGVVGGVVAGAAFKWIWRALAHEDEAPKATDRDKRWPEIVAAAAVEGAVFGAVKAAIDRAGATGFSHLTGVWPGRSTGDP